MNAATTITIHSTVKPASKADAQRIVRGLLRAEPENRELQSLLLYFSPKPSKAPKTAEQWLATFCGVKDVRYYLNYLYSDGKRLIGCDGHTLAWAPTERPAGYYCPRSLERADVDARFPDIDRVIRALPAEPIAEALPDSVEVSIPESGKECRFVRIGGGRFNPDYIARAAAAPGAVVTKMGTGSLEPLRGRSEFGEFIIMGLRF